MSGSNIQDPIRIKIRPSQRAAIDELVDSWDFKTKESILGMLESYRDRHSGLEGMTKPSKKIKRALGWFLDEYDGITEEIKHLNNEEILFDWTQRYKITGEMEHKESFDKIFEEDLGNIGIVYAIKRLRDDTNKVYVPPEFGELIKQSYNKFVCRKIEADRESKVPLPKAPLFLVIGPTGSGKSATVEEAIEQYLYQGMIFVEEDYNEEIEKLQAEMPYGFWESKNKDLVDKVKKQKLRDTLFMFKKNPKMLAKMFKEKLPEILNKNEELQRLNLARATVNPSKATTMMYGESANMLEREIGDIKFPKIVHLEEMHNIVPKNDTSFKSHYQSQEGPKVNLLNKMLDETIKHNNQVIWVGTTHSPEQIAEDVYRRFDSDGMVIDIMDYWKKNENLEQIVRMEAREKDIKDIDDKSFREITEEIYKVFDERTLDLTPAYVRKLLASIIEKTGTLEKSNFEDKFLLRNAFKNVARHVHSEMYKKIVKDSPKDVEWNEYVGMVKDKFAAKANAALRHNDENKKGVVLIGPPGSGKTYLTKVYAAANPDISYISASQKDLQGDSMRPIDGMIENIHIMYNIARMLAPSLVSIQEADAIMQQRSENGTNPYDKVTNTFLDIFDGDTPLRGVYTAMTTNMEKKIDSAFIRAKRADILEVSGRLSEANKKKLIGNYFLDEIKDSEVTPAKVYKKTKSVCYVPADFRDFVEKIIGLRDSQYKVLHHIGNMTIKENKEELISYAEQNTEALIGILKYHDGNSRLIEDVRSNPSLLVNKINMFKKYAKKIKSKKDYPVKLTHLNQAYEEFVESPMRKGLQLHKEYLSDELSREPQVGVVVGAGVAKVMGMLLPLKSALSDKLERKIEVTGAVEARAIMTPEYDMAVRMMKQSAVEAKTLILGYLSQLVSEQEEYKDMNITGAINELL